MRIWFFGTSAFAVPSLERLVAEQFTVDCCITQPDRPQGRGQRLEPSPVKQAAVRLKVPLLQPERLSSAALEGRSADLGIVAAYGQLIKPDVLTRPRLGMIGVHPSLLPKYRGAAPINWALLKGEQVTGMSIFRLVERLDAGEILLQESVPVLPADDAETLGQRLALLGAECVVRAVRLLESGRVRATAQDDAQSTYAPKLTKAQGRIDWQAAAEDISALVRATVPWPGAWTVWRGEGLKIWRALVSEDEAPAAAPGTVVRASQDGIAVRTGRGILLVQELQAAGKRRMAAQEFLAGRQMSVGERLGED
ncbi:MAG: methionyl-tRNA formyltransferase [Candidatus Omnitrophica bacterium CG11_big_fil_rev_8_21_14_0_20_63_9]|nr:MAG: methionyl-tRNA formyltransferase [Candidatus Omnitrophica bacterium CG11_big_fil_rev_8_21_14_0_20_63_9]